jgi:uncharacterized membrane protein YbhN (UPF0104 family)
MSRKSFIQLLVGLLLSGFFLYWVFRPVDFQQLGQALIDFQWLWAFPFLVVTALSLYLRAVRWRILLSPVADLSSRRLFSPLMAGFALNNLLPARAGEFARALFLNRADGLPLAPTFATIVVERLMDMIVLLSLLAFVFLTIEIDPSFSLPYSTKWSIANGTLAIMCLGGALVLGALGYLARPLAKSQSAWKLVNRGLFAISAITLIAAALIPFFAPEVLSGGQDFEINGQTLGNLGKNLGALCGIIVLGSAAFLVPKSRSWILWAVLEIPYAPRTLRLKIRHIADGFASGLQSLTSPGALVQILAISFALWLLVGMSFQIAALGFKSMSIGFVQGQAINVLTCLAILIPAAPGFWGLMELGIVFSLAIFAIESDPNKALAFALLVHSLQYFPIVIYGLGCLWNEKKLMGKHHPKPEVDDVFSQY